MHAETPTPEGAPRFHEDYTFRSKAEKHALRDGIEEIAEELGVLYEMISGKDQCVMTKQYRCWSDLLRTTGAQGDETGSSAMRALEEPSISMLVVSIAGNRVGGAA